MRQHDFLRARAATLDDGLFKLTGGEAVDAAPAAESGLQDPHDALLADDLDAIPIGASIRSI